MWRFELTRTRDGGSRLGPHRRLRLVEEFAQRGVDLFGVGPADVVGSALDPDEPDIGDQGGQPVGRRADRQDPVLGAV
jgi:hypothetical protein